MKYIRSSTINYKLNGHNYNLAAAVCLRTEELPISVDIILSYMPMCNGNMVCYQFERRMGGSSSKEEVSREERQAKERLKEREQVEVEE